MKSARNILAALGAAGLILTGCGGGSPKPTEQPIPIPTSAPVPVPAATPTPVCWTNEVYVGDVPFEAENFRGFIKETPSPEYIEAVLKYNKFLIEADYEGNLHTLIKTYFRNKGLQIPEDPTPATTRGWASIIGFDQEFNRLYTSFLREDGGYTVAYFPEELDCPTQGDTFTQGLYNIWYAYRGYTSEDTETVEYFLLPSAEDIGKTSGNTEANAVTVIPIVIQNQQ